MNTYPRLRAAFLSAGTIVGMLGQHAGTQSPPECTRTTLSSHADRAGGFAGGARPDREWPALPEGGWRVQVEPIQPSARRVQDGLPAGAAGPAGRFAERTWVLPIGRDDLVIRIQHRRPHAAPEPTDATASVEPGLAQ